MARSWAECERYLRITAKGCLPYVPLLRDGRCEVTLSACAEIAPGQFGPKFTKTITVTTEPFLLKDVTRSAWAQRLKEIKKQHPALGITGLAAAKVAMAAKPGQLVCYDGGSGYISSIGLNIERYLHYGGVPAALDAPVQKKKKTDVTVAPPTVPPAAPQAPASPPVAPPPPAPPPAAPPSPTPPPVAPPPPAPPPAAPAVSAARAHEAPGRRDPPDEINKLLRTASAIPPLVKYLKSKNKFNHMGMAHWREIRKWCETADGMRWLERSGLDPLSFHLHHFQSVHMGGHYSIYNCVLCPGSANAWFGALDSREMREWCGDKAAQASFRHAKWMRTQIEKAHVDQSLFDPDFA